MIHNGKHSFAEPYFEWWYFHFISETGYCFNLLLHPTDIFAVNRNPYMSVSLVTPDDRLHYFREDLPPTVFDACVRGLDIDNEKLKVYEEADRIRLEATFDQMRFRGTIAKDFPAYVPNGGVLFRNETHQNFWFVQVPHGNFDLRCELSSEDLVLSGSAYHDHNWGNARIQEYFEGWTWSHLVWEGGFLLLYHVNTSDGSVIQRGLLGHEGKRHVLQDFEIKVPSKGQQRDIDIGSEIHLVSAAGNDVVLAEIKTQNVFRKREDDGYLDFVPNYYRAKCTASVSVGNKTKQASGLVECLKIVQRHA
jgi:hypothetical protein